jgi:hypothetical protein
MSKVILFFVLLVLLFFLMPISISADSSDNVTLITNIVGDNATVHLITNVVGQYTSLSWFGCCGDGWGEENDVPRSTPLYWLSVFPNMITGIVNPDLVCSDIKAEILRIEPSSVTVGTPVNVVFVVESNCYYKGNISLLLNGQSNQSLGVDLTNLHNKTYRTTIPTTGLQSGKQNVLILGSTSYFMVANNVIPTTIEPPQVVTQSIPAEKTEDKIFMWVAIAIGGIILVTIILLIILR